MVGTKRKKQCGVYTVLLAEWHEIWSLLCYAPFELPHMVLLGSSGERHRHLTLTLQQVVFVHPST